MLKTSVVTAQNALAARAFVPPGANVEVAAPPLPSLSIPSLPFPSPPLPSLRSRPLNAARGLGERFKLPQWGLGRSLSRQTIWYISGPKINEQLWW